jgi:hypothetical protein
MNIEVEYKNQNGNITNRTYYISRLAFVKHMAIAGQRYAPHPKKILKTIAMFLQYGYYLQRNAFYKNRFSLPPREVSDPTEKGQFSNIAGKAIADFLAKRIDNALYTVNYEAAMRILGMPINGSRPDLLAFNNNATFAIEAKGYSGSAGNMNNHKAQSRTGRIPVNFTVASVSYNLYENVRCNYYDPYNDNIPFDNELFRNLTKEYYSGFYKFMEYGDYREINYQNESFYEVDLFYPPYWDKHFKKYEKPFRYFWEELFHFYRPRLIIPSKIQEFAKNGINNEIKPFLFENKNDNLKNSENRIYIDNDRIGLKIERNGW